MKQFEKILYLGICFEFALGGVGILWCVVAGTPILMAPGLLSLSIGLLATLFLLLLQEPFYRLVLRFPNVFAGSNQFVTEVVRPFCNELSYRQALLVAVAAGVGEELLFRAALLPSIGVLASSLLFAVIHFGLHAYRYPLFVGCYFLISVGFSYQYLLTGDIGSVILTHVLYDFLVIVYLKTRKLPALVQPQ